MGDAPSVPTGINGGEMSYSIGVSVLHTATIGFSRFSGIARIVSVFIAVPNVNVGRNRRATVIHIHQLQFHLQWHTGFVFRNILAQNQGAV